MKTPEQILEFIDSNMKKLDKDIYDNYLDIDNGCPIIHRTLQLERKVFESIKKFIEDENEK